VSDLATSATGATAPVRPDQPWRRAWLTGLATWAIAYLTYMMINAAFWAVGNRQPPPLSGFFDVWNRWDTGHYVTIATSGYDVNTENPAFFPLYPLLMATLDPVLPGQKLAAGLIIASGACVAALAVIHRLVEDLHDSGTAQRTVVYVMASPFAFFLVAAYNESLLLALCAGSLYCMHRGRWWYAGLLAALASATRQAGVLLAIAFAIEYLRQRGWMGRGRARRLGWDALAILLVPTGVIAFMVYSDQVLGDPLKFLHVQAFWGRELSPPWVGTVGALDHIAFWSQRSPLHTFTVLNVIDLVAMALVIALLVLTVVGPWRLGPQSWYLVAFGAAVIVMVLLTPIGRGLPPLHGLPRYALEVVAIFIVLARMGANSVLDRAYLFPAIALQATLLVGFFANVWLS
jgi:Gpi18-like mannosyltransferase